MVNDFVSQRVVKQDGNENPKKSFYDPVSRSNIKTMGDMNKTVAVKSRQVKFYGEIMYLRLLAIDASKKMPLLRECYLLKMPLYR